MTTENENSNCLEGIDGDGDVPVTAAFLNLVHILDKSRSVFISDTCLARDLGDEPPLDWDERCRDLFFNRYADSCEKIGLSLNEQTYRALVDLCSTTPEALLKDMNSTQAEDLPTRFIFNPWIGMGRGGVRKIDHLGQGLSRYTAFCHDSGGKGTIWISALEVPINDDKDIEMEAAKQTAIEMCARDWEHFDGDSDVPLTDSIVCMGLATGEIDIADWDDSHLC